jgi:hypothetical protein
MQLSTLDASAVKARLAEGNPKDPFVLKMLSFIDVSRKKKLKLHSQFRKRSCRRAIVGLPGNLFVRPPHEARGGSMSVLIVADSRSLQEQ